jgi:hypothetical protein
MCTADGEPVVRFHSPMPKGYVFVEKGQSQRKLEHFLISKQLRERLHYQALQAKDTRGW